MENFKYRYLFQLFNSDTVNTPYPFPSNRMNKNENTTSRAELEAYVEQLDLERRIEFDLLLQNVINEAQDNVLRAISGRREVRIIFE